MSQKDSLPDTRPKTIQAFRVLHGLGFTEAIYNFLVSLCVTDLSLKCRVLVD